MSLDGVIVVDKPSGMTSFDVIRRVRKKFNIKKIGHAGTLDPMATGVLILLCGKATKLQALFMGDSKTYRGVIRFGIGTDSDDITGSVTHSDENFNLHKISDEQLRQCISNFSGRISQIPPQYSAIKVSGKRSYDLARKGVEVEHKAREVEIYTLDLQVVDEKRLSYEMHCSKGTYVRSLARDIGSFFNTYACVEVLRRTESAPFNVDNSHKLEDVLEVEDLQRFMLSASDLDNNLKPA